MMENIKPSPFTLDQFQINDFSIKREAVKEGTPEFKFKPTGFISYEHNTYLLTIDFKVKDSNSAYNIKCNCIGFFRFKIENNDRASLGNYFYLNAPAIVFPYIRSFIASITALSGLPAVHLPTLTFAKTIGEDLKKHTVTDEDVIHPKREKVKTTQRISSK